jgi:WD40 repeat protein
LFAGKVVLLGKMSIHPAGIVMKAYLAMTLVLCLVLVAVPVNAAAPALKFEAVVHHTAETLDDFSWKPDGSFALACGSDGNVFKYINGNLKKFPTGLDVALNGVDWKPDGSYALIVGEQETVLKFQADAITIVKSNGSYSNPYNAVRWNPSGTEALLVGGSPNFGLVNSYDGNTITDITLSTTHGINDLRWSPDGTYCLMVSDYGEVYKYSGGNYTNLPGAGGRLFGISWNAQDSSALIVGLGGDAFSFDGKNFTKVQTGTSENLFSCAWKQDGTVALATGEEGSVFSYDGATFKQAFNDTSTPNMNAVAWHPGGKYAMIVGSGDMFQASVKAASGGSGGGNKSGYADAILMTAGAAVIVALAKGRSRKIEDPGTEGPGR